MAAHTDRQIKQAWMREQHNSATAPLTPLAPFAEHHYSVNEVAVLWTLSTDAIRKLFQDEPGVLVLGGDSRSRHKRRYTTLRIPESVVARVHKRMTKV
jgi:hypothetical protein